MGALGASRARIVFVASVAIACAAGCRREPPLVAIGGGWFVEDVPPGLPWPHLFFDNDGDRVIVDRHIESYRLYSVGCLAYEAPRSNGRTLFVHSPRRAPLAIRMSGADARWRLDTDGPKRFDRPIDPGARRLLRVTSIKLSNVCDVAGDQPPFRHDWSADAPYLGSRLQEETSVVDVDGSDSVGNSTIAAAARQGQAVLVDELLMAGADPNAANQSGSTVLMTAATFRHPEVVRRLIAAGARVDARNSRGQTALMLAARSRNVDAVKALLEAGADATLRDDSGQTAFGFLSGNNDHEMRELRELLGDRASHDSPARF